jgi:PST family polysaccharide transporter
LLSQTTFGDSKHIFAIALMSLTLLFGGISAGQSALLQGLRRLRDLAASQIVGTLVGAVVSVGLVWWLREQGIVPYLVAGSALAALLSWWYARRVSVRRVTLTWRETLKESRGLLGLGLAFTFSGLVGSGTDYFLRVLVQRQLSMEAVGIYTATWTLSTYYVGFVLTAMCTDFMPRLTAAANDHSTMNRLLNEQIEMGVLIALPGVLASLTLAPWVLKIFYSASFMNGAAMARWQILGMFLRVVSWPLGYVLIAKGRGLLFTLTELAFGVTNVGLILLCMKLWKLEGVGVSFALCYLLHTAITTIIARWLTGFRWSAVALRIFAPAILILGAVFGCARFLPARWSLCIGLAATALAGAACLLALQKLLGVNLWQAVRRKFQEGSL